MSHNNNDIILGYASNTLHITWKGVKWRGIFFPILIFG